jgi:hypothetical protein
MHLMPYGIPGTEKAAALLMCAPRCYTVQHKHSHSAVRGSTQCQKWISRGPIRLIMMSWQPSGTQWPGKPHYEPASFKKVNVRQIANSLPAFQMLLLA